MNKTGGSNKKSPAAQHNKSKTLIIAGIVAALAIGVVFFNPVWAPTGRPAAI